MSKKVISFGFSGKPYKLDKSKVHYVLKHSESESTRRLDVSNSFFDDVVISDDALPEYLQELLSNCIYSLVKDIKASYPFDFDLDFKFKVFLDFDDESK